MVSFYYCQEPLVQFKLWLKSLEANFIDTDTEKYLNHLKGGSIIKTVLVIETSFIKFDTSHCPC